MNSNIINIAITVLCLLFISCKTKEKEATFLVSAGSDVFDECYGLVVDSENNYIISGVFSKEITFKGDTFLTQLSSNGNLDFFVAKYSAAGKFIWAKQFGGKEDDEVANLCIDEQNNLYLTGYCNYSPNLFIKEKFINKKSFLLKLNASGEAVWAKKTDGQGSSEGTSIYIKNKSVFWLSTFSDSISDSVKSVGLTDIVCTKLDYNGTVLKQNYFGDKNNDNSRDIVVSDNNAVFITCSFSNKINYGISSASMLELDSNLTQQSFTYLYSDTVSEALSIILDKNNNKYISGSITGNNNQDAFVCKLSDSNKRVWTNIYSSSKNEWAKGLAFDTEGNIISTVVLNENAKVSTLNNPINGLGNYDIFINKLDAGGKVGQYKSFGNSGEEGVNKIIVDKDKLVFCGWFYKTLDINNKKVSSKGDGDIFLCKEKLNSIFK